MFTLAHLSDPHIGPLPDLNISQLMSTRFFGYRNWKRNRHKIHSTNILNKLVNDIKCQKIDHVALTGDLVNISLEMEFARAHKWLKNFGREDWISVIPGNHDAYVDIPWKSGLGLWQNYMTSNKEGRLYTPEETVFPYVRIHGKFALIGLNSGAVFPPLIARGALGIDQMQVARETLNQLGEKGFYRIIMIHHPPLPGQNIWRKALKERHAFKCLLEEVGAELILHGHNHLNMYRELDTKTGPAHIFGVPSASGSGYGHKPAAGYNIYQISKEQKGWQLAVIERAINVQKGIFETIKEYNI